MNTLNKNIVIAGPTGVGKTYISIQLAKKMQAEIISADSAQVYIGLDIGTAKISEKEMENIKHHMIDVVSPEKKYNVGIFEKEVNKILNTNPNKKYILVGGTGLYINSITNGLSLLPKANQELREKFSSLSIEEIIEELNKYDREAIKNIGVYNRVRLERALEVCVLTGEKFSVISKKNIKNNECEFIKIALERSRENLYERINQRVDIMINKGLVKEVEFLYKKYARNISKLNIIGYSEIIEYLNGEISLEKAIELIKKNSRHYAKRQFTWFKADKEYTWFNLDEMSEDKIIEEICLKNS